LRSAPFGKGRVQGFPITGPGFAPSEKLTENNNPAASKKGTAHVLVLWLLLLELGMFKLKSFRDGIERPPVFSGLEFTKAITLFREHLHRSRSQCAESELAAEVLPCGRFGASAAWLINAQRTALKSGGQANVPRVPNHFPVCDFSQSAGGPSGRVCIAAITRRRRDLTRRIITAHFAKERKTRSRRQRCNTARGVSEIPGPVGQKWAYR
jgi:hypothetical protein